MTTVTTVSTLTSKHQATIPRAIRDALGLRVGDRIEFVLGRSGVRVRKSVDAELTDRQADDAAFSPEWLSKADEDAWRHL